MSNPAPRPAPRRPSPTAAAAWFVVGGIFLLLLPELAAKVLSGSTPDVANIIGDVIFLAIAAGAVWYMATRIEAAFVAETTARTNVERRERILAEVIDVVPAAVLLLGDADELTVTHANPAASRLLDLGTAGPAARRLEEALPIDMGTVDAITAALADRSGWAGERSVTTNAGRRVPLSIAVTPITPGGGVNAVLVATDRSELHFAERESERLAVELEGFVHAAPVGFVTVGPNGLVAAWNAAAQRILGWTAAEMVGSHLPDDLGRFIAESLAAGAGLSVGSRVGAAPPATTEVRLRRSSGESVVVRLAATTAYGRGNDFFGFTAMFEDVTEARRIEAERDEAESRFRAAVDASPLPLVLLDPEGKVRLWSGAAEHLFGWTADEAMGKLFPPVPDDGLPQFFARLQEVMDGETIGGELLSYVGRDGRVIPTRVWSAPVRASNGSLVGVIRACREEPEPPGPLG
jgi:PAS domain S-box-containing protein